MNDQNTLIRAITAVALMLASAAPVYASYDPFPGKDRWIAESSITLPQGDSTSKKIRAFVVGMTYGNNSAFLGRYQSQVLPYYAADFSYKSKTGLSLSLFAYDINNSVTFVDELDLMAGWTFDISKRVDGSLFYTRYFFTESTDLLKASVANTATASLGLDWGYLYSKVTGHYIPGGTSDVFMAFDNSRYIEFPEIIRSDDYLSLEPKISIVAGTQTFVDTYYVSRGTPLGRPPGRGNGSAGNQPPTTIEYSTKTFNVLSYEFYLPVAYSVGSLSFEISGRYIIPVNLLEGDTSIPRFFFTGGIAYYFTSK